MKKCPRCGWQPKHCGLMETVWAKAVGKRKTVRSAYRAVSLLKVTYKTDQAEKFVVFIGPEHPDQELWEGKSWAWSFYVKCDARMHRLTSLDHDVACQERFPVEKNMVALLKKLIDAPPPERLLKALRRLAKERK